ncbi:MAG: SDR family oxidoreductase [Myxococcaceae bacterium]|nr:SDR family oxidoreductase [Myxococcaceae bacterium]
MKAVLVTGAARRIGQAIALRLSADGYDVVLHHNRSRAEAAQLRDRIIASGGRARLVRADLTKEAQVRTLVERSGPLTALVNNASVFRDDRDDFDLERWNEHFAVHARAPYVLTQAFAAQLGKKQSGAVVNLVDQRVLALRDDHVSYSVSKYALLGMTRVLALKLAPRVRVNAVAPGPVLQAATETAAEFQKELESVPLLTAPTPEEVADAVAFLVRHRTLTGQTIAVDSGQHLGSRRG